MATTFSVNLEETERRRKEYKMYLSRMGMKAVVKEFLSYLDHIEESESGREFHPITIGSCRVLMTQPLDMCLKRLRELVE